jgi:hypothetical protein
MSDLISQIEAHAQKVQEQQVPVEDKVDSQQIDGQTAVQEPPVEPVTPVAEEVTTVPETEVEEPKSWDADEIKEEVKPNFNFSQIGSALNWGEIKDENDFIKKATEFNSKFKELEQAPLATIPDDLRGVVEIAKAGGDYKDYLANQITDFTKVDPLQLYENDFYQRNRNNPKFFENGKLNEDLLYDELDKIPDDVKYALGDQQRQAIIYQQNQKKAEIKAKAEAKIAAAETSLAKATNQLPDLLPFENYGIKFEPKHSSNLYQGVTSSKLTKAHLGTSYDALIQAGVDMNKLTRTMALAEYGEKMIKFKAETAEAKAKKAILETTQNVQLKTPGSAVKVEDQTKKVYSPAEIMAYHMEQKKKKDFFAK